MSKQLESTPPVHCYGVHDRQSAFESVLVPEFFRSPETTSRVKFPSDGDMPSSSGTEPPGKRRCLSRVQVHEGNPIGRLNGEESSIFRLAESAMLLGSDGLGIQLIKSCNTGVTPLPAEGNTSMRDLDFLTLLLTERDPFLLEQPEVLQAYFPVNENIDSDYSKTEIRVSDYRLSSADTCGDVIVIRPMVSERENGPPPMEASISLSEQAFLIFQQTESALPLDAGLPFPEFLDFDNRDIPTESGVGKIALDESLLRIPNWPELLGTLLPAMEETDLDSTGVGAASASNTVELQYCSVVLAESHHLASEKQAAPSSIVFELERNGNPMSGSIVMQHAPPPQVSDSYLASSSEVASASCSKTHGKAQRPMIGLGAEGGSEVEENTVDPRIGERTLDQPLPRRRLLIEKELTESDIEINVTGIKLPKESTEMYFNHIPEGSEGLAVTIHDAVAKDKTWIMRFTVAYKTVKGSERSRVYTLKDTWEYLRSHALDEGDWLQIFSEEPGHMYIIKFEKSSADHNPPSYQRSLLGKTWKLILRKTLTRSDTYERTLTALGAIALDKKKVEQHFPPVEKVGGLAMTFHDWDHDVSPWAMKVKFSTHKKGRIYRLESTAKFCRSRDLQKHDYLEIFKSNEPNAIYAVRGCKLGDRV